MSLEGSSQLLEAQKSAWIQEQIVIASRVEILASDTLLESSAALDENDRFLQVNMKNLVEAFPNSSPEINVYFGGIDVSFPDNESHPAVAVYIILKYSTMKVVYTGTEYFHLTIPYIPSFLAFREIEPLERLVRAQISTRPELTPKAILVDGNGVLHSRGAGIACFLGVRTGVPTIGIGKTLFCEAGLTKGLVSRAVAESMRAAVHYYSTSRRRQQGSTIIELSEEPISAIRATSEPILLFDRQAVQPNNESAANGEGYSVDRGSLIKELSSFCHGLAIPLLAGEDVISNEEESLGERSTPPSRPHAGRTLACALVGHGGRVQMDKPRGVGSLNPIFVSVGHKLSLQQAVAICASLSLARIPEPLRQADLIGRELLRKADIKAAALESTATLLSS